MDKQEKGKPRVTKHTLVEREHGNLKLSSKIACPSILYRISSL